MRYFIRKSILLLYDRSRERNDNLYEKENGRINLMTRK